LQVRAMSRNAKISLVKRLGQRFESARRLSFLPANAVKTQSP
jgi:hypothetical protein